MAHYSGLIRIVDNHYFGGEQQQQEGHEIIMKIVSNLLDSDVVHFPISPSDPCLPIIFKSSNHQVSEQIKR